MKKIPLLLFWLMLAALPPLTQAQSIAVGQLPKIPSLSSTDLVVTERVGSTYNPGLATLAQIQAFVNGAGGSWTGNTIPVTKGGTGVTAISGLLRGNGTSSFSNASAADVVTLWNGCSSPTTMYLRADFTCVVPPGSSGSGTVTSVGLAATPAWLTLSGTNPITISGTITIDSTAGLTGNQVLATPNGSSGKLAVRALVANDIPQISLATGVTSVLPAANGGTGVNNGSNTQTLGGAVVTSGTFTTSGGNVTLTVQGNTNVTMPPPTSGAVSVGFMGMPLTGGVQQTGNYTYALADIGTRTQMNCAAACTVTIPANGTVAFPVATTVLMIENVCTSSQNVTIAITTDTLYLTPTAATGSRTLAPCGIATVFKETTTSWMISGTNIT